MAFHRILGLIISLFVVGCSNYDITVNDTLIYGPSRLLSVQAVSDEALAACLRQHIEDANLTRVEQVTAVNCSNAGIGSLDGLAQFNAIDTLKLSGNALRNLVELERLTALTRLWLDDNQVIDAVPLAQLKQLTELDLSGNTKLQCPDKGLFAKDITLRLPSHCAGSTP